MIYDIKLSITYSYDSPAAGGRHLVRLMPADIPGVQRLVAGHLDIAPDPAERTDRTDFFGNLCSDFSFRSPHDEIALKLHARVQRLVTGAKPEGSAPLADLPRLIAQVHSLTPNSPVHFTAVSPRVPRDRAVIDYARRAAAADSLAAVEALGQAIHAEMTYDPEATDVDTPMSEAFAARHGVCQDFSHIMIAGLRGIGIPAGYVSGFLRTIPPPGKPRLEGADAMHAWIRAWCGPEAGWVEYDPTNRTFAGRDHIAVAYGRDYFDVAPVKGVLRIYGEQKSEQAVDVIPLDGAIRA